METPPLRLNPILVPDNQPRKDLDQLPIEECRSEASPSDPHLSISIVIPPGTVTSIRQDLDDFASLARVLYVPEAPPSDDPLSDVGTKLSLAFRSMADFDPALAVAAKELVLRLAPTLGPLLGTALGAWVQSKAGRKVRIKIGDVEAEARTPAEIEKLLEKAQEFQQRKQPKKIHEP